MALSRSGSQRSTLSVIQRKATKYQNYLTMNTVILLVVSTILIFTAIILIKFYHVDKLNFWSIYFAIVPNYMVTLGIFTFLICFFGFAIAGSENKSLIVIYAVLLAIAFLGQLGSIFVSLELRTIISQASIGAASVNEDLKLYGEVASITAKWDELQRDLYCCGGNNFLVGYNDYKSTPFGRTNSVPDSCCHQPTKGCGKGVLSSPPEAIRNKIFVNGCMTLLQEQLENEVLPMLIVYACVGVVMAIVELLTIVLASAYVAQINRRIKKENRSWGNGDRVGDAFDGEEFTYVGTMI